jgi:glucose-1-phosphate thymidylyltransferase
MIEGGEKFTTFPVSGWYDCGKPDTLLSTNKILLQNNTTTKDYPSCIIVDPVFIADNAIIKNAIIGPNATIGEDSVITDAIIRDSIIGSEAKVIHIMLSHSIVGSNASITGNPHEISVGDYSEIQMG